MRWLWRLLVLLVFLGLVRTLLVPQPKEFISWSEGQNWVQKIQLQIKQWQKVTQDLPTSIEVEVRRLWRNFNPNDNAKEV